MKRELVRYEALLIRSTLDLCRGNQTAAAKLLGMPRRTLVRKLGVLRKTAIWREPVPSLPTSSVLLGAAKAEHASNGSGSLAGADEG